MLKLSSEKVFIGEQRERERERESESGQKGLLEYSPQWIDAHWRHFSGLAQQRKKVCVSSH